MNTLRHQVLKLSRVAQAERKQELALHPALGQAHGVLAQALKNAETEFRKEQSNVITAQTTELALKPAVLLVLQIVVLIAETE